MADSLNGCALNGDLVGNAALTLVLWLLLLLAL